MRRLIGIVLLIFALAQFAYRGMERIHSEVPLWDFDSVYAASRTWIHGGNPYDVARVVTTWQQTGLFPGRDVSYFATVYPPTSLCMLVPFALMPAAVAILLWLGITLLLSGLMFGALIDLVGFDLRDPRALILIAASLASAPFQYGILSGQLSEVAIPTCVIGVWCACRDREAWGGVLLGLACALKPQIAAPVVAYFLLMRRWSIGAVAVGVGASLLAIALVAMRLTNINWIDGWMHSIALTTRIGGVNDYGWTGYFRDEIMDLKLLLVSFVHDPNLLRAGIAGVAVVLTAWYLRALQWHPQDDQTELLMLAGLTAISFVAIYHRVYDAALLTPALAWALAEFDGPRRRYAIVVLVPMAIFLIPFDITGTVGRRVHRVAELAHTNWWQSVVAPHYAWAMLLVTLAILLTMSRCLIRSTRPAVAISRIAPPAPTLQGS